MKPAPEELVVWDSALPGFGLRIKPTGIRSYIVQYRTRDTGQSKRMTIGQHGPLLTFDQAKRQARGFLTDAARGQDPVAERRSKRQAPTMRDLASDYLEKYAGPQEAGEERAGRPGDARQHRPAKARIAKGDRGGQTRYRGPACRDARSSLSGQSGSRLALEDVQPGPPMGLARRQPGQRHPA